MQMRQIYGEFKTGNGYGIEKRLLTRKLGQLYIVVIGTYSALDLVNSK